VSTLHAAIEPMEALTEHLDVLIVGAGISGVGAAYHLKQQCASKASAGRGRCTSI
jgi:cation diffusion facilitator CzcD-associated flavoprotein CzcO